MSAAQDQKILDQLIAQLEQISPDDWKRPWDDMGHHRNATTDRPYAGINTLLLTVAQHAGGYEHPLWCTYKQAQEAGAQVRKGEKSTTVVFYKALSPKEDAEDEENGARLVRKSFRVFNVAQLDGYELPPKLQACEPTCDQEQDRLAMLDRLMARTGARLTNGPSAAYNPKLDSIMMPSPARFESAATYGLVLLHELGHWTGHTRRCNRDLSGRFGNAAYAAEELVAELFSAHLSARLGLTVGDAPGQLLIEHRRRHAAYLKSWLEVLKHDPSRLFTADGLAQRAIHWLDEAHPGALSPLTTQDSNEQDDERLSA